MATMRSDFTFRTELFGGFPNVERSEEHPKGYKVNLNQKYHCECVIREDSAEYSIDGKFYARTSYQKEKVP